MPSMRDVQQPRVTSLDIIGRLSGVTRPTPSPPEGYSFRILLDHPSNERLLVRYSRFHHLTPFDLNGIVDMERQNPVICILTAVTITNPGADALILDNTPASRIVFPPFSSPYRPYFDLYILPHIRLMYIYRCHLLSKKVVSRFSHLHVPVRMMHPRRPHHFAFLRGELPDKLFLSALLRQQPAMLSFQNHHSTAWCLVRLLSFDRSSPNLCTDGAQFSYTAIAKCADATATTNILFSGPAAALLFRMQPAEYVLMTVAQEDALLASLQGHLFIVEVRAAEPGDIGRARLIATNIWDPVAAFY
ncbi:hypothetical protein LINGRAHAP2_LOCUS1921 [Linum grandiflorum]